MPPIGASQQNAKVSSTDEKIFVENILVDPRASEKAAAEFNDIFKPKNYGNDYNLRNQSFRWYTMLVWRRLESFDENIVVNMAFKRQAITAILLDIDVQKELMWYLSARPNILNQEEVSALYGKIRSAFLRSGAIAGRLNGKEITVSDLVREYEAIKVRGADSLETVEFRAKLKRILFADVDKNLAEFFMVEPDIATQRLFDLIMFFAEVKEDQAWYALSLFLHPEGEPKLITTPSPAAALGYKDIRAFIDSKFKKTAGGEYENMEGVMAKLGEMAEKYANPKIAEMYYYDEKENKFKWTE